MRGAGERANSQPLISLLNSRGGKHVSCDRKPAIDITTVYCKYYQRVLAWCSQIVRNAEDAEDLTQEAFIQVMRRIDTFRGEAAFSTWLHRVVMNTVFMHLRRKRLPQTSLDGVPDTAGGALRHAPAVHIAAPIWRDSIARIDLDRAIGQLATGFKLVLLLHDVQEYYHSEIAKLRGSAVGTSKSQLHKARQRLRELLGYEREKGSL